MSAVTQGIFVLVFLLALVELVRYRDRARLEVAALSGVLALAILIGLVDALGVPHTEIVASLLIVAQPYLFLRLIGQFRSLPRLADIAGVIALLASWLIILIDGVPLSSSGTIAAVVLFAVVEGYAVVALVQAARETHGIARRRLEAIIAGSAALVAAILLAGVRTQWPDTETVIDPVSSVLALVAGLGYYVGFVPPRRLRRLVQLGELGQLLLRLSQESVEARLTTILDQLGPAATRAVGGKAAVVALIDHDATHLRVHLDPVTRAALAGVDDAVLQLSLETPAIAQAWRDLRPVICTDRGSFGDDLHHLVTALGGARACLIAPLVARDRPQGLMIVLLDRYLLFVEDDLALLTLLADQTAIAIEGSQLFQSVQREAAGRRALLELSQALADETEVLGVAERLMTNLHAVVPSSSAGVLLPLPSGELEVIATAGPDAERRRGIRIPAGAGVTGTALAGTEPVVVHDVRADPRYVGLRPEIRSELAVPLRYRDATVGVLNLERAEVAGFGPSDVALVQIVASHAAQAIARAQLLEQLRQQNVELELANRHKGEFLANMSHELRTPLNAIIGFSELLLDDIEGYPEETEREFLTSIHDSGQHLLSLINDILDLAKVEAGHMTLSPETVLLDTLVRQVLTTIRPLADRKDITVSTEFAPLGEIFCDPGKVKQILYNLLSNAIKFTPDGGAVAISTRPHPDGVQLTVADTGIGIAPEDLERVFLEFQQLDTGADRHYEGTGLGLTLTQRFVAMHGGQVWVESTPGAGSRFHVVLPRRALPDVTLDVVTTEDGHGPLERLGRDGVPAADRPLVLVVEDDPQSANLFALYLGRGGYRAEVVPDGRKALDRARELHPAAITLDIMLPGMDGWEVLRQLKQDERTHDIPVLIASIVDDQELGLALGATDYLVKPVSRQSLLGWLERRAFTARVLERAVDVLVVDDDRSSVELLAGMLAPAGFGVVRAYGGAEAIDLARARLPDLILLDLMMPEVSGFEVVDALRADPSARHIPIVIVTAKDLTRADKERLNGHVSMILHKGTFGAVDLIAWLDETLGYHRGDTDEGLDDGRT